MIELTIKIRKSSWLKHIKRIILILEGAKWYSIYYVYTDNK